MNEIILKSPEFLNPHWFNTVVNRNFLAIVESNAVDIEGETLTLASPVENGTEIRVYLGGRFFAVLESEVKAEEEKRARLHRERAEQSRQTQNRRREEAEAFNATIGLPVKWWISQKEVLSGLSMNSNGDGRFSKTVEHVELLEDLEAGRIRRRKNDFLCTSKSGSNGNSWSGGNRNITYKDGDGKEYMPKPTCKQCLKLLDRFRAVSPE